MIIKYTINLQLTIAMQTLCPDYHWIKAKIGLIMLKKSAIETHQLDELLMIDRDSGKTTYKIKDEFKKWVQWL